MPLKYPGIAPYSRTADWTCADCDRARSPWVSRFGGQTTAIDVSADAPRCSEHRNTILTSGSRAVTLADLGAAKGHVVRKGTVEPRLYIWNDVDLGARLVKNGHTESTVEYSYLRAGGPRLELRGEVISVDQVVVPAMPVPRGESGFTHTLPIASQYLHLVDESRTRWHEAKGQWEVWLRGRPDPVPYQVPTDAANPTDGIVIWPRAEYQGASRTSWRRQMVGVIFRFADAVALVSSRPSQAGRNDSDEAFEVSAFANSAMLIDAAPPGSRVRYVVLGKRGPGGLSERGAVPIQLTAIPLPRSQATGWIALDFGTANTTVVYQLDGDAKPTPLTDGVASDGESFYPSRGAAFARELEDTMRLYSGWYKPEIGPKPMQGTLLFKDADQHSVVPRSLMKKLTAGKDTILGNLKWQGLETYDDSAVRAYMERVLLPAFHALVAKGVERYRFVATYPLAFDPIRRIRFEEALKTVLTTIEEATKLERLEFKLISESHAGTHAVAARGAPYSLTLDMGGGTTDLALIRKTEGKKQEVLMAESLRIGARDLIRAALHGQNGVEQQIASAMGATPGPLSVSAEVAVESLLGMKDAQVRLLTASPSGGVMRRQRIAALLSGVIVAAVRLVVAALAHDAARNDRPKINVFLLGQGWHLMHNGLLPEPFTEERFLECLQERGSQLDFQRVDQLPTSTERKLQLVNGAISLAALGINLGKPTAGSYAGMDIAMADGRDVQMSDPIGAMPDGDYAYGDPGVDPIIEELLETMETFATQTVQLGTPARMLNEPEGTMSGRERLILGGNLDLSNCRHEGEVIRSPLTAIIDGAWVRYWSPRSE